jgi:hypothetical protein
MFYYEVFFKESGKTIFIEDVIDITETSHSYVFSRKDTTKTIIPVSAVSWVNQVKDDFSDDSDTEGSGDDEFANQPVNENEPEVEFTYGEKSINNLIKEKLDEAKKNDKKN